MEGTLEGEDGQAGTAGGLTADAGPQLLQRWWLTVTLPPLGRRKSVHAGTYSIKSLHALIEQYINLLYNDHL